MVDVVVVVVEVMVVAVAARHPLIASPSRSTHVPTPLKGQIDASSSTMTPNAFFCSTGEIVYYTAAVGVVLDHQQKEESPTPEVNSQRFFQSHDDDILCICLDESRNYVATGQVKPLKRKKGMMGMPTVCIWDVHSMQELMQV